LTTLLVKPLPLQVKLSPYFRIYNATGRVACTQIAAEADKTRSTTTFDDIPDDAMNLIFAYCAGTDIDEETFNETVFLIWFY
jgi:hypothetical protein